MPSSPPPRRSSIVRRAAGAVSRRVTKTLSNKYQDIDGNNSSNDSTDAPASPGRDVGSPQSPVLPKKVSLGSSEDMISKTKRQLRLEYSSKPERLPFGHAEHNTSGANRSYGTIAAC